MKMLVPLLLLALACKPKGFDARCTEALNDLCTLRVACGFDASFPACQETISEQYVCDTNFEDQPQIFDPCIVKLESYIEADPPVCISALPLECSDALCSVQFGCDFVTTIDTSFNETGQTLTFPHSGGTGAGGSASGN
jgi:hypothetical protein